MLAYLPVGKAVKEAEKVIEIKQVKKGLANEESRV
jgi:hypothetical protein